MKKRIWICLVLAILFVCLIGVLAGCNPDETSEETTAPLAGKFINDSGYWLDSDTYVITHTLEYFSNGTAQMQVSGILVSDGEPVNFTLNGVYLWQKGDSVIYCTWTGSSVVEYLYNGTEIHTGYAVLRCVGWNSLGEFEGIYNLVSYGTSGPGRIEGEVMQFIPDGESARTVTAVPSLGAEFVRWSDGVMTATRTDNSVSDNIEVNAEFKRVTDVFSLKYSAGEGGTIQGATTQEVLANGSGTEVTAVPDEGYGFIKWSDGVTTATRTDTNITQHLSVTAEFGRKITLSYSAGEGGTIEGETVQSVIKGGCGATVTAVPNEGWYFVRWSDGVTTASRTDADVTGNISVTAEFEIDPDYTPFAGGDGSVENPYMIDSLSRLRMMSLYPSAHFVLTADIVLPEVSAGNNNFTPLFSDEKPFLGTLDGAGHKITNLAVYNTETFYSGLFSVIGSTGSVKNLTLENASVSGTNYVGIVAGWSLGSITDCTVSGAVTHIAANGYKVFVGGIAGRAEENVDRCLAAVNLAVTEAQVEVYGGGIVGYLSSGGSSSSPLTLTASGTANVSGEGYTVYIGGLVGYIYSSINLSNCHTEMQITAIGSYSAYAGGLVGFNRIDTTITDSYATGNVSAIGSSSAYVGGLIGRNSNSITITDSYATGNVSAIGSYSAYAGGLVGQGGGTTVRNAYSSSAVSAEGGGTVYVGGLAGCVGNSVNLENAHWLKSADTDAVYAVGYSGSLGVPTSIGSTSHAMLDEFYTLADTLNAGREAPVWEHTGENTLPSLINGDDESAE